MDVKGKMKSVRAAAETATARALTMEAYHEVYSLSTDSVIPMMDINVSILEKLISAVSREGAKLLDDLRLGEMIGEAREKDRAAMQNAQWEHARLMQNMAQQNAIYQDAPGLGQLGGWGGGLHSAGNLAQQQALLHVAYQNQGWLSYQYHPDAMLHQLRQVIPAIPSEPEYSWQTEREMAAEVKKEWERRKGEYGY